MGVSVNLSANSVWLQNNIGKSSDVFNHNLIKEKLFVQNKFVKSFYDKKGKKTGVNYKYYLGKSFEKYDRLPLVPWSTNKIDSLPGGNVTMKLSVAEVGNPSLILKTLNLIFGKNSKSVKDGLKSAAESVLKEDED